MKNTVALWYEVGENGLTSGHDLQFILRFSGRKEAPLSSMVNVPSSPYLEFETQTPNQKGVIFSGMVDLEWDLNDDHQHTQTQTIPLGYKALAVLQSTVSFGLTSVYGGGNAFLFAINQVQICIDSTTQELSLLVDLALMGKPGNLSRYSYQAVVVVTTQQTGIFGTISYPLGAFGPANPTVALLAPLLDISANIPVVTSNPGFGTSIWERKALGTVTAVSIQSGAVHATYSISAAPYNLDLTVLVNTNPDLPQGMFQQTPSVHTLRLTTTAPVITGIDFSYASIPIIK